MPRLADDRSVCACGVCGRGGTAPAYCTAGAALGAAPEGLSLPDPLGFGTEGSLLWALGPRGHRFCFTSLFAKERSLKMEFFLLHYGVIKSCLGEGRTGLRLVYLCPPLATWLFFFPSLVLRGFVVTCRLSLRTLAHMCALNVYFICVVRCTGLYLQCEI